MISSPVFEIEGKNHLTAEEVMEVFSRESFPAVRENIVTFVFHGEADHVELRHWIFGLPSNIPLKRFEGTSIWACAMEFPTGSRVEYKFIVHRDGHEHWILDPLNSSVAHDPFGGNSVVHCSGYSVPEWTLEYEGVAQGRLETIEVPSHILEGNRTVKVYLPPKFRSYRRHRLLVAHDGDDYIRYSNFTTVLNNLIDRLEIPPLVVALTNPVDRLKEYADDPRHAQHIVEELIPTLEQRYSLIREASGRCIMGASFGAVASLSTAWRYPNTFNKLLLQSGSFAFTDIGEHWRSVEFDPVVKFMNAFRKAPGLAGKQVFLSCGVYESLIYENRSMSPFLLNHGVRTRLVEAYDGHNWENWRDRLRDGLTWLFQGPYWATYL